ncbi:MAG: response regulator transcription factor [Wenzhouxiangellaceae bacterium]|nr:response regulator transcription factor [Wenzhouxiangellaceae bacterium]MBS3823960.1 response regulator transcription factor [Wenzhouxiangellaceae bacterium]
MNRRRVLIADDHGLVRSGIRLLLQSLPDVEVVAESGDGLETVDLVHRHRPDLLLLDISLPGLNGLEVLQRLQDRPDMPRIIMLSMHAGPEYVARALNAGAAGYLIKDAAFDELEQALATVAQNRAYLSQALDPEVVERFRSGMAGGEGELEVLTPRQRQILQLIAEGHGTRRIGEMLHVSVKTVETHRAQLMDRLGIHDVAGLVRFAIRAGLIEPQA